MMMGVRAGPCCTNQLRVSATSLMALATPSGGIILTQSMTMLTTPMMASLTVSHAALNAVMAPLSSSLAQRSWSHLTAPWMAAWMTGVAAVRPSPTALMAPVTMGLTLSSTVAPILIADASRLPIEPSMVVALVAACTAASWKPSFMIASLNSCALISPSLIASLKLPV